MYIHIHDIFYTLTIRISFWDWGLQRGPYREVEQMFNEIQISKKKKHAIEVFCGTYNQMILLMPAFSLSISL